MNFCNTLLEMQLKTNNVKCRPQKICFPTTASVDFFGVVVALVFIFYIDNTKKNRNMFEYHIVGC